MLVRAFALSFLIGCAPPDAQTVSASPVGTEAGADTARSEPPSAQAVVVPVTARDAVPSDSVDADLSAVPQELRRCVAASVREGGLRFEPVAEVNRGGTRYILIEGFAPDGRLGLFSFVPRLLRVEGTRCENVLAVGTDDYDIRGVVGDEYDELIRQAAASEVERVGGPDAFEAAYRRAGWLPLHECALGELASDVGCFEPDWAAGYRAAGVAVGSR